MKTITLDIETTGIPPKGADYKIDFMSYPRILSIAYKFDNDPTSEFIINQNGFIIPTETKAINGITQEMCEDSPYQLEGVLVSLIEKEYPDVVIGHNIYFDTSIIKANILRLIDEQRINTHVYDKFEEYLHKDKRIDTMRAGQKLCGGKWPKLSDLHLKLFGDNPEVSHSSIHDVNTTYKCFIELRNLGIIKMPNVVTVEEEI